MAGPAARCCWRATVRIAHAFTIVVGVAMLSCTTHDAESETARCCWRATVSDAHWQEAY